MMIQYGFLQIISRCSGSKYGGLLNGCLVFRKADKHMLRRGIGREERLLLFFNCFPCNPGFHCGGINWQEGGFGFGSNGNKFFEGGNFTGVLPGGTSSIHPNQVKWF